MENRLRVGEMTTSQIDTVHSGVDRLKLLASVVLLVLSLVGFYLLAKNGPWVQWGVLLIGMAAAATAFMVSERGRQLSGFVRDASKEVKKVVWPTRKETFQMTAYVFGFVVVMALFLWLTDKTLEWVLYDLVLGWRRS